MNTRTVILTLVLLIAVSVATLQALHSPKGWGKKASIETMSRMSELRNEPNGVSIWPPNLNDPFPKVALFDHTGQSFNIDQLRGKPTLIEFVAMTCAACQAWSGANKYGPFEDLASQDDLMDIESTVRKYANGLELTDGSINFVQLVIYNTLLEPPQPKDLEAWRTHFKFDRYKNFFVVSGGKPLSNKESFNRIPGLLLLDKNLVVRYDALGHNPIHNVFTDLLPAIPTLLEAKR